MNEYNNIVNNRWSNNIVNDTIRDDAKANVIDVQKKNKEMIKSIVVNYINDLAIDDWNLTMNTDGSLTIDEAGESSDFDSFEDALEAYKDDIIDDIYQGILNSDDQYDFYLNKDQIYFLGMQQEYDTQITQLKEGLSRNVIDVDDSINDSIIQGELDEWNVDNLDSQTYVINQSEKKEKENVVSLDENIIENPSEKQKDGSAAMPEKNKKRKNDLNTIAKQIDTQLSIQDVAIANGLNLVKNGRTSFRDTMHDSLIIDMKRNMFFWNSQGKKGGCVQLYMELTNSSFREAVLKLMKDINLDIEVPSYSKTVVQNELSDQERHKSLYKQLKDLNFDSEENKKMIQTKAYLTKTRGLDSSIVDKMIQEKMIYQISDKYGPKVAFAGRKDNMILTSVCQRSVNPKNKFKGDFKDCNYNIGWFYDPETNGEFGAEGNSKKPLLAFEANIDMISYMSLLKECNIDYTKFAYIACSSINHEICIHETCKNKQYRAVRVLFDNDYESKENWGKNKAISVAEKLTKSGIDAKAVIPDIVNCKDWNDILVSYRRGDIAIDDLKEHITNGINDLMEDISVDAILQDIEQIKSSEINTRRDELISSGIDSKIIDRMATLGRESMILKDDAFSFLNTKSNLENEKKTLLVFESNKELLSYIDLLKSSKKDLTKFAFISSGELNQASIQQIGSVYKENHFTKVYYMANNQIQNGKNVAMPQILNKLEALTNEGMNVRYLTPSKTDTWNETLCAYKNHSIELQTTRSQSKSKGSNTLNMMRHMQSNPVRIHEMNSKQEKEIQISK